MITNKRNKFQFNFLPVILFVLLFITDISSQNDKYELVDIRFVGNKSFSPSELLLQLESKKTPFWLWKFLRSFTPLGSEKKYYDSLNVPIDIRALTDFYLTNGFFLTKVRSETSFDSTKKSAILTFYIEEGNRSVFGKLNLYGFEAIPEFEKQQVLRRFSNISEGIPFRQSEITKSINETLRYLTNNGYLFAKYDSAVVVKDTTFFTADVYVYFDVGQKYYFSDLIVVKSGVGANSINDDLIRDIVAIKEGEVFDQSKLERSELRLLRTGLFNSLSVTPLIKKVEKNLVPIEILARVGSLNEISPELKVDNDFNSFNTGLGFNIIRKNFLGNARKLNISSSFRLIDILNFDFTNFFSDSDSTYQGVMDIEIGVEQPYLFGRPILTSTKTYFRSSKLKSDREKLVGASQSFDFEMPEYTFITLMKPQFALELTEFNYNLSSIGISIDARSLTPSLGIELGSYKTDNLFFPLSGYNLYFYPEIFQAKTGIRIATSDSSLDLTETGWFWRVQTSFSQFVAVSKDKNGTLGFKFKAGYLQSIYGAYDLVPPNRTFFSGGSNSIRGWRLRELLPKERIEYFGILSSRDRTPRGGTFLLEGSIEFRRKFLEDFGFATFIDYGNVWNGYKLIQFNQFAVATGFGLRYYSPIAPFRIDFGLKFYNPDDKSFIFNKKFLNNIEFHFGIGEAF